MTTRTIHWTLLALVTLTATFSSTLVQAGGHGFGGLGARFGGGGFYRGGSRSGSSMYRNMGHNSSHSNGNWSKPYPVHNSNQHHNNGNSGPVIVHKTKLPNNGNVAQQQNNPANIKVTTRVNDLLNGQASNHHSGSNGSHHNGHQNHSSNWKKLVLPSGPLHAQVQPKQHHGDHHQDGHHHDGHHGDGHHHGHHHNWNWIGFNTPWVYGSGYGRGGYCHPTVINHTTVVQQPVVQVPVAEVATADQIAAALPAAPVADAIPDLALKNVSLLEAGSIATGLGPTYRVVIANVSDVKVDRPFTVTLVAAKADRSFDANTPRTDEPVVELAAGQEKSLDIRLPVESLTSEKDERGNETPFSTLLVVIDGYAKLAETNRDNNAAALARTEVEALLPTIVTAETVAANGNREVNVAGKSFGADPGKVMIDLGTVRVPAEVVSWDAQTIKAKLPAVETAASVTTKLVIVRADGTAAEPFDLTATEVAAK